MTSQEKELKSLIDAAHVYYAAGFDVTAVATLTEAITKAEEAHNTTYLVEAYRLRGATLLRMGDKAGAEADGKALMALDPEQARVSGQFKAEGTEEIPPKEK